MPWKHGCVEAGQQATCGRAQFFCPQKHSGGLFIGKPKSRAGNRQAGLPTQLIGPLRAHRDLQSRAKLDAGDLWTGFTAANGISVDLVFCTPTGRAINTQDDWTDWKAFLKKCKVPTARVHDARHTTATVRLVLGVPLRTVMEIMGWTSMTMPKRYQHVLDELKREAAEQVGAALFGDPARSPSTPEPNPIEDPVGSIGESSVVDLKAWLEEKQAKSG